MSVSLLSEVFNKELYLKIGLRVIFNVKHSKNMCSQNGSSISNLELLKSVVFSVLLLAISRLPQILKQNILLYNLIQLMQVILKQNIISINEIFIGTCINDGLKKYLCILIESY